MIKVNNQTIGKVIYVDNNKNEIPISKVIIGGETVFNKNN